MIMITSTCMDPPNWAIEKLAVMPDFAIFLFFVSICNGEDMNGPFADKFMNKALEPPGVVAEELPFFHNLTSYDILPVVS